MKTINHFSYLLLLVKASLVKCIVKHLAVLYFALSVHIFQVDFLWFSHNCYVLGLTYEHHAATAHSYFEVLRGDHLNQ